MTMRNGLRLPMFCFLAAGAVAMPAAAQIDALFADAGLEKKEKKTLWVKNDFRDDFGMVLTIG